MPMPASLAPEEGADVLGEIVERDVCHSSVVSAARVLMSGFGRLLRCLQQRLRPPLVNGREHSRKLSIALRLALSW